MWQNHKTPLTSIDLKWSIVILSIFLFVSCTLSRPQSGSTDRSTSGKPQEADILAANDDDLLLLQIPELEVPTDRSGPIKVIATTSIIPVSKTNS